MAAPAAAAAPAAPLLGLRWRSCHQLPEDAAALLHAAGSLAKTAQTPRWQRSNHSWMAAAPRAAAAPQPELQQTAGRAAQCPGPAAAQPLPPHGPPRPALWTAGSRC